MLLAIDIGNTDTVFALNKDDNWIFQWREQSNPKKPSGSYELSLLNFFLENGIDLQEVKKCIISSVVPELSPTLTDVTERVFGLQALVVDPTIYTQLNIKVNNPAEIGTDLVANAVAAYHMYKDYCIVIDFGTALTFTTIENTGQILGVAITPGLNTAIKSLFHNTAKLPEIPLEVPTSALGKNTIEAMQAGILLGYEGLVAGLVERIIAEVGKACKIVVTGGHSSVLKALHIKFNDIDPLLTLKGLKIISDQLE